MALSDVIARIQGHALSLSGMKDAPVDPPESANSFPFTVTAPRVGSWRIESSGFSHAIVTLRTEIHVNRQNLPTDTQRVIVYFEPFIQKLLGDQTLNGTVETLSGEDVTFAYGSMTYAGVETLGWAFDITVKIAITT